MQYKFAYFDFDEDAMISFVDKHWNRVVDFGLNIPGSAYRGYSVRYTKDDITSAKLHSESKEESTSTQSPSKRRNS